MYIVYIVVHVQHTLYSTVYTGTVYTCTCMYNLYMSVDEKTHYSQYTCTLYTTVYTHTVYTCTCTCMYM